MNTENTQKADFLSPWVIDWVISALGSSTAVEGVRRLPFSSSSSLYRLDVRTRGGDLPLVLRLHTNQEWLAEEPDLAAHEAAALQTAARSGLPVPELIAVDVDGTETGLPALLTTHLPGTVNLLPDDRDTWLRELADLLPPLHALEAPNFPWQYAPYYDIHNLSLPAWSSIPARWAKAISVLQSSPPPARICFIHRDFHPVNVLWQGHRVSGLVDWPNACLGPAGVDVAWMRMNLSAMVGVDMAEAFLAQYESISGTESAYHPYWDLLAIMDIMTHGPSVYPPWVQLGIRGLSDALMRQRADEYLECILQKITF